MKKALLVVALLSLLRFWQVPELLHWTFDEEVYAYHLKRIVVEHHIPLIGVSSAPVGIELGPLFYWSMALPFWIGGGDPVYLGYVASFIGVITSIIVFYFLRRVFNSRVGFFGGVLYASSSLMVMYDRHFWSVTPQLLVSFLVMWSFWEIIKGHYKWFIVLAFSVGYAVNSDLLSVVYVPVAIIALLYFKVPLKGKYALTGLTLFLLMQLPLVAFDIRHDFHNSRALLRLLSSESTTVNVSINQGVEGMINIGRFWSRFFYIAGDHDLAYESTYCAPEIGLRNQRVPWPLMVGVSGLIAFLLAISYRRWNEANPIYKLAVWQFGSITILLFIYQMIFNKQVFEFYLISFVPIIVIAAALFLESLWQNKVSRLVAVLLLIIFVVINVFSVFNAKHSFSYNYKKQMSQWVIQQVGEQPFAIEAWGGCHQFEGHRYVFDFLGHTPSKSYIDPLLGWLYNGKTDKTPSLRVIFVSLSPSDQEIINSQPERYPKGIVNKRVFGGTEVLIINDE